MFQHHHANPHIWHWDQWHIFTSIDWHWSALGLDRGSPVFLKGYTTIIPHDRLNFDSILDYQLSNWTNLVTISPNQQPIPNINCYSFIWAALREKVHNVLSRCHTRPSFFWYDTDFLDNFWKKFFGSFLLIIYLCICFFVTRPSFFWYDNDSGHQGPFRVTPLIYYLILHFQIHTISDQY